MRERHPIALAQAGHESLRADPNNEFSFVLEAPFKACRLCGAVYQSTLDRKAYELQQRALRLQSNQVTQQALLWEKDGRERRERWLELHNRRKHPHLRFEIIALERSGLPYTPQAAKVLASYGIIYIGEIFDMFGQAEIDAAMLEAPRNPISGHN